MKNSLEVYDFIQEKVKVICPKAAWTLEIIVQQAGIILQLTIHKDLQSVSNTTSGNISRKEKQQRRKSSMNKETQIKLFN